MITKNSKREKQLEDLLMSVVYKSTPMNWHESAATILLLEKVCAVISTQRATYLRQWLATPPH